MSCCDIIFYCFFNYSFYSENGNYWQYLNKFLLLSYIFLHICSIFTKLRFLASTLSINSFWAFCHTSHKFVRLFNILSVRFCSAWAILDKQESIARQPAKIECTGLSLSMLFNKYYYSSDRSLKTPEPLALGNSTAWNRVIKEDIFSIAAFSGDLELMELAERERILSIYTDYFFIVII